MAGDGRRVARSRERVSEHRSQSSVRRRPGSPAASRSVRPPWRPHDCTKRESLLVFSVARASRSVSRDFAPPVARRVGLVSHSHGAQWLFQTLVRCRLAAAATPGAHGTPPAQAAQNRRSLTLSESPRGLNPLNCCALALPRPLPHGPWPAASAGGAVRRGSPSRLGPVAPRAVSTRRPRRNFSNMAIWYAISYGMTYNGTEQSTSSPCVMDAIFMHG